MADWDIARARAELGVSESFLRALVRQDRIPHYRLGSRIRFEPDALRGWRAAGGTQKASSAAVTPDGPEAVDGTPDSRPGGSSRPAGAVSGGPLAGARVGSSAAWRSRALGEGEGA